MQICLGKMTTKCRFFYRENEGNMRISYDIMKIYPERIANFERKVGVQHLPIPYLEGSMLVWGMVNPSDGVPPPYLSMLVGWMLKSNRSEHVYFLVPEIGSLKVSQNPDDLL